MCIYVCMYNIYVQYIHICVCVYMCVLYICIMYMYNTYIYVCVYIMEYYSAIKKNEIIPFATTWMQLEIIIQNEVNQTKTNTV